MNTIQKLALQFIKEDAKSIYSIYDKNPIILLCTIPYLGLFVDGADKWGEKTGIPTGLLNEEEQNYYEILRNSIKIFDKSLCEIINNSYKNYNYQKAIYKSCCNPIIRFFNLYDDIGIYYTDSHIVGNTILIGEYLPEEIFKSIMRCQLDENNSKKGQYFLRELFVVGGEILGGLIRKDEKYNTIDIEIESRDYNLRRTKIYKKDGFSAIFILNLLCTINFILYVINKIIIDDTLFKFRIAYLVYYHICTAFNNIKSNINTSYEIDKSFVNYKFRNCMAHYGLGQSLREEEIIETSPFGGLIEKYFKTNYDNLNTIIINELTNISALLEKNLKI